MEINDIDFDKLREPFKETDIQWRIIKSGKNKQDKIYAIIAAYVDNRAIQERLDIVVGIPNWESHFTETAKGMICGLSICGVTKSDGADYTNIEPTKGGISDAMKRAGSQWGIGQYLYKLDTQYAIICDGKYSGTVKDKNGKVTDWFKWNPPKLPKWALPEGSKTTTEMKPPKSYPDELKEIHAEMADFFKGKDTDGTTEATNEFKKIAKEFNQEKLLQVKGFDQAKVILRLRDKLKEIKGDK